MRNGSLQIREATSADVPLILDFIRGLAEYERLAHKVVATEESLRHSLFGDRPIAEVLLAFHHAKPAGFALFFHNYSTFLAQPGIYLEDLFVKPELRGFGVGRALLEQIVALARQRNCGRVEWSVLDWNDPAIGFYKKLGAVPLDEWTMYRLTGDALAKFPVHEVTNES
jgi:GNAT superfamily N-acetyltransferase